jgi:hypothetical protein
MSLKEDVVKGTFVGMIQLEMCGTSVNAVLMEMLGWEM